MGADWYYVGSFGQLGPLTLDQMRELASDGVIERSTYVWQTGMANWTHAENVSDLAASLGEAAMMAAPPPPPTPTFSTTASIPQRYQAHIPLAPSAPMFPAPTFHDNGQQYLALPMSDRNRILAGVLQLIVPGAGRMYMGYWGQGVAQLLSVAACGIGFLWSIIDGIAILSGSTKVDGYGRALPY